jgi:chemotaxis protein MotB
VAFSPHPVLMPSPLSHSPCGIHNPASFFGMLLQKHVMKKTTILCCLVAGIMLVTSSCVSKKKYNALNSRYSELDSSYKDLEARYGQLGQSKQASEQMSEAELRKLNEQLKAELAALENSNKRVAELQGTIQRQRKAQQELLDKITKALVGFNNSELTAEIRADGKLYVSLSEKLLFKSGKYDVDPKGKEALQKLGEVLSKQPDIDIVVEGHTDTVPFKRGELRDNMDLSVMRATTIMRLLSESYGVNPKQITAAGRGEHFPVATNNTAEGRAANRRTEIILSPKISELFKLLSEN